MTERTGGWLLAIDTSTEQAGLAATNGAELVELSWRAGRDQTVSVLEQIDRVLKLARIDSAELAAVAVATGPGMFNGLRVGMSLAKGLHLGIGMPLIGVSTLELTAHPFRWQERPVVAVVAAGRGRIVWQRFPDGGPPVNGAIEELIAAAPAGSVIAGELSAEQEAALAPAAGLVIPTPAARARRPASLAEIGWRRFVAGDIDDPTRLTPVYVHGAQAAKTSD